MTIKNMLRSLLVGAGIEAVLAVLIRSAIDFWKPTPLPFHPVALLAILIQLPGVLLVIPVSFLEPWLSTEAVGKLELIGIWVVILGQAVFFAMLHYRYVNRRSHARRVSPDAAKG